MIILIVSIAFLLTFITAFFLKSKKEKVTIKVKLHTSTQLNINYSSPKDTGELNVIKSSTTLIPRIDPTLTGWKLTIPLNYSVAEIVSFLKGTKQNTGLLSDKHLEGLELMKFLLASTGNYENKENHGLLIFQRSVHKQLLNFTRLLPDVNYPFAFYDEQSIINKRGLISEQPKSA